MWRYKTRRFQKGMIRKREERNPSRLDDDVWESEDSKGQ